MAIQIPQGYIVTSNEPIDKRLVMTKRQMRLVDDDLMPDVYFCICAEKEVRVADPTKPVHKIYMYNKVWPWEEWVYDEEGNRYPGTGRFRPYAGTFEDLDGIPYINGVKLSGSEGTGETYHLQDFLIPSEGILIERNSEGHFAVISAHIDNDTIKFFEKGDSEGSEGRMFVVTDNLMSTGEAIEFIYDDPNKKNRKPSINVLYDSETIHLNPDNRLEVRFDPNRALGLDLDCEGGAFYVRVDGQTITYKDGMLHGKPEPLMDGIATHIRYRTSEWDSEHIDLVYDSEKGLGVDAENQLFIKLNEDRALEFDDNGQIQTKLDSEQGLWFNNDGEVFIKLNGDQALEFNSEGYVQLKIENSEGLEFDEFGKLRIKLSESEGLEFKPNGDIRVKVDENSVYLNSEGQLELRLNENHGIMVSEGLLYVKVDDNSIYINSETGNLELRWDENRGITVTSEGLLAAKVDGDTIHFDETTGVFELHLDSERGITTDSEGKIYIKVDDSTIHINSENGNLELHLDTNKGIDVDSEGNLFVRIDDSTIHFDSEGNLELHLNTEKGIDVDSEGQLFVRVDQNTIFFDSEGNLELHVNAGRGIGNDSEGLFVKVDGVSVVINSEGELSSAFNVNEALEMVITSEGPVANVLYDGRFNRSEGTIFLDSEHNCLWVNDVAYDGLHSPKGTLKDIIPENAGNPSVMDPRVKNKLVDHDEMTWMITGNNNTFRGSYDSEGGLEAAWPKGTANLNDYAFVSENVQGSEGPIYYYDRYKCVDSEGNNWKKEFRIATMGFTLDQWKAINSDIKNPDVVAWRDHRNAPITASEGSPNVYNITYDKYGHIRSASKYNPDWEQETTSQSDFIEHRPAIKRDTASSALTPDRNTGVRMNDIANNVASGNYALAEGGGTRATGTAAHAEGWQTNASGSNAHAEGFTTTASGAGSHAEGGLNEGGTIVTSQASGNAAHAEGASIASGMASHAEGRSTQATNSYSHAEGLRSVASGTQAHAEGEQTTASGVAAHAEGYHTQTSADYSHTEGYYTLTSEGQAAHAEGNATKAYGAASHTEGYQTRTSEGADYSHAEGVATVASGIAAHVEGGHFGSGTTPIRGNIASGVSSHAEGVQTEASGKAAHTEGYKTIASGMYSHAEGSSTQATNAYSHAEGNSTQSTGVASHAEGNKTIASGMVAHAEGMNTDASGRGSHAEGYASNSGHLNTASGQASHAEGDGITASGYAAHAEGGILVKSGVQYFTVASGGSSHAEGAGTTASGPMSHAEGSGTVASNTASHAEGELTAARGRESHAEGRLTVANAESSHAEGQSTTVTVTAEAAHAEGRNTVASGLVSHVEGYYTTSLKDYQHVQGTYNDVSKLNLYADVVGWGTSATDRKNISSLTTGGDLHLKKKLYINSKDDGTGGLQLVPALTQIGDVLKIKYMPSATSEGELEWGPGGGGGGLDGSVRPGRGITFDTGVDSEGNPVTYINANISLYSAGSGINISPAGVISTTAAAPSFSNILGQARDNTNLNAELTTIDTAITNLRTTKQDKLTAGNGITISGNVISSKLGAGDSTKIVNDKIEVKSPITGSNGILVTGGWNATGWNIAMDLGTSVTGTPAKPVPGSAISTYVTQNFKPLQTAVADPTAVGSSTQFISNISQDANGVITVTKKNLDLSSLNIGNGTLTFKVNGTSLGTFTANQATNKTINYTPSYNDLSDKPTIPAAAGNGTITLKNGNGTVSYGNFTVNQSTATTINIPTGTVVDIERW